MRIQLVDTPGHADFGGEVERVLGLVDGVLLVVDAVDGPMPQTRFVLGKALAHGLRPIVVVNKVDRAEQRAASVVDEVFDLLVELGADDRQLDFPVVYCSAVEGTAVARPRRRRAATCGRSSTPSSSRRRRPCVDREGALQLQACTLGWDDFVGRLVIGRIARGQDPPQPDRGAAARERARPESFRVTKLFGTRGLERVDLDAAEAGDIVILAGPRPDRDRRHALRPGSPRAAARASQVDPPTLRVCFSPNTSPFAGSEGRFVTSRQIDDRLRREALSNVGIRCERTAAADVFEVAGRGELQIGVLIETMRREGYEFSVSRPEIILREVDGVRCEPVEDVVAEVPEANAGAVMERARPGARAASSSMETHGGRVTLELRGAEPRPLRLPQRVPLRHARRGRAPPHGARLRALRRRPAAPPGRRHRRERGRQDDDLRAVPHPGARRRCSSARASRSTRARSSARAGAPATST